MGAASKREGPQFTPSQIPVAAWFALAFGLFLGLAIWKFGNAVILDAQVGTPGNPAELWNYAWPTRWAYWGLIPLLGAGALLVFFHRLRWPCSRWLWLLPFGWLGWQFASATHSVDASLTRAVLAQFCGCVGCYFVGALVVSRERALPWLLVGLLTAFTWCLIRATNQKLVEFPREHAELVAGERNGWTNFTAEAVIQMRVDRIIITTNGVELANPQIVAKYAKGRVSGTLMYPNALAGLILLLLPVALVLAITHTDRLRPWLRGGVVSLTVFLGGAGLFWTGSKLGWLVGLGLVVAWLMRFDWPRRWKLALVIVVMLGGLGGFAWRFQNYLASGAKSVGARFDYWHAAGQVFARQPVFGSGPGTFQRPYAEIKAPESEMARLVHNDYLEQFSDSGLIGGLAYLAWIAIALASAGRLALRSRDLVGQGVFIGVLGWFVQGFGEFSLYVPALAWTAFSLLGALIATPPLNRMDRGKPNP
jgi:hypothetical protein